MSRATEEPREAGRRRLDDDDPVVYYEADTMDIDPGPGYLEIRRPPGQGRGLSILVRKDLTAAHVEAHARRWAAMVAGLVRQMADRDTFFFDAELVYNCLRNTSRRRIPYVPNCDIIELTNAELLRVESAFSLSLLGRRHVQINERPGVRLRMVTDVAAESLPVVGVPEMIARLAADNYEDPNEHAWQRALALAGPQRNVIDQSTDEELHGDELKFPRDQVEVRYWSYRELGRRLPSVKLLGDFAYVVEDTERQSLHAEISVARALGYDRRMQGPQEHLGALLRTVPRVDPSTCVMRSVFHGIVILHLFHDEYPGFAALPAHVRAVLKGNTGS